MTTGTCTACALPFSLRVDGTVRTHGPYKNRCPGSNQPPVNDIGISDVIADGLAPLETINATLATEVITPVEDMVGIYGENWTGGLSSVEFVRQQRDPDLDPVLAEVGDSITSILDEAFDPIDELGELDVTFVKDRGNGDVPEVVRLMAREHNDLLRMADCRTLAAWAAGKRDEIQAMTEERAVRNARYDRALEQWVAEARDMLAAVTA